MRKKLLFECYMYRMITGGISLLTNAGILSFSLNLLCNNNLSWLFKYSFFENGRFFSIIADISVSSVVILLILVLGFLKFFLKKE